ncbi:MAG: hypothetical protein ACSLFM_11490 [Tepidiformaceae bacterium]
MTQATKVERLTINWGQSDTPEDKRHHWMAVWIVDPSGMEGDIFYDAKGGATTTYTVPPNAVGFRLRAWVHGQRDATFTPIQLFADTAPSELHFEAMSLNP